MSKVLSNKQKTLRGSIVWSLGGLVFMAFMISQFPGENFPLPEALEGLRPLAQMIGNRATAFLAGWLLWSLCGVVGMWRLVALVNRHEGAR